MMYASPNSARCDQFVNTSDNVSQIQTSDGVFFSPSCPALTGAPNSLWRYVALRSTELHEAVIYDEAQ